MGQKSNFEELGINNFVTNIKYKTLKLVAKFEIEGTFAENKNKNSKNNFTRS